MADTPTNGQSRDRDSDWPLPPTAQASDAQISGVRVLLAEDHRELHRAMRQFLEDAGASVESAYDGREAVTKALSSTFDVVLMIPSGFLSPMTSDPLLIYGATGYTGSLVVKAALARGLRPILGGRNKARLEQLAHAHGLQYRAAPVTDAAALDRALTDIDVLLVAAGPFSETALPLLSACLRRRTHYLDLSGECAVIETVSSRGDEGRRRAC